MLPLRVRVDLGAMAMKGYSAFPKAPAPLEPHSLRGGSYPSAEVQCILQPQLTGQVIVVGYRIDDMSSNLGRG